MPRLFVWILLELEEAEVELEVDLVVDLELDLEEAEPEGLFSSVSELLYIEVKVFPFHH